MLVQKDYKFWFCTGSQDLYGDECLAHVAEHSQIIVKALNESGILPYEVVWKPTLITNEVIRRTFNVSHVVSYTHNTYMTAFDDTNCCTHPVTDSFLCFFVFPVTHDDFTVLMKLLTQ